MCEACCNAHSLTVGNWFKELCHFAFVFPFSTFYVDISIVYRTLFINASDLDTRFSFSGVRPPPLHCFQTAFWTSSKFSLHWMFCFDITQLYILYFWLFIFCCCCCCCGAVDIKTIADRYSRRIQNECSHFRSTGQFRNSIASLTQSVCGFCWYWCPRSAIAICSNINITRY